MVDASMIPLMGNTSIGALGGANGQSGASANPLASMGEVAQTMGEFQKLKVAQNQFAAQQRIGQIMAAAPNFEAGITAAQSDPLVAAFGGAALGQARQTQQILTQTQGEQAKQNRDAMGAVLQGLAGAAKDPTQLDKLLNAQLANVPPEIRSRIAPSVGAIKQSLLDGLPSDPTQAASAYNQRVVGMLTSSGMTPDAVAANVGKPTTYQVGDKMLFGTETPGQVSPNIIGQTTLGAAPSFTNEVAGNRIVRGLNTQAVGWQEVAPATTLGMGPEVKEVPQVGGGTGLGLLTDMTGLGRAGAGGAQGGGSTGIGALGGTMPSAPTAPPNTSPSAVSPPAPPGTFRPSINSPAGLSVTPIGAPGLTPGQKTQQEDMAKAQVEIATNLNKKYQDAAASNIGDMEKDFNADAKAIPNNLHTVDILTNAVQHFQTGGGAGLRDNIGQLAQGLKNAGINIPQETIDKISNGSLSYSQFFTSVLRPQMVAVLKENAQGTGRVMHDEVTSIINSLDVDKDPATVMMYLNKMRYTMKLGFNRADQWRGFRDATMGAEGASPAGPYAGYKAQDYPTWYAKNVDLDSVPDKTPSGLNFAPVDPSTAMGSSAAAVPQITSDAAGQEAFNKLKVGDSFMFNGQPHVKKAK